MQQQSITILYSYYNLLQATMCLYSYWYNKLLYYYATNNTTILHYYTPIDTETYHVPIPLWIQRPIMSLFSHWYSKPPCYYTTPDPTIYYFTILPDTANYYVTISLSIQQTITLLYLIDTATILLLYPYVTTIYYDIIFLLYSYYNLLQATMFLYSSIQQAIMLLCHH